MKPVTKAALGIALAFGPAALIAAPAQAAKKEEAKQAKQPELKLSKEFRAAAGPLDAAAKAQDWQGVLTAANTMEASATTPDEKYVLNQYRLNAATSLKNAAEQGKAIDAMLATGKVSAADAGKFNFFSAQFALERNDYAKAEASLNAAVAAGYTGTDVYLSQSRIYSSLNRPADAIAALDKAVKAEEAAGRKAPEDWYKFGFGQAYKAKNNDEFVRWTSMHVKAYPTPENWRSALVNFRDVSNPADKPLLDLYRLMLASNSLAGEKDHYEYAYLANRAGLPGEVKMVTDHFKGGASKAIGELSADASGKVAADKASLANEAQKAASAANGVQAAGTGNAYIGYQDYAKAAELFRLALSKGGVDADEVNTRLGIALALQGQKDAAKEAFAKVQSPARVNIARYWTTWLDRAA